MKQLLRLISNSLVVLACCLSLIACAPSTPTTEPPENEANVTVGLIQNEHFTVVSENPISISEGGEAHFELKMKDGYTLDEVFWRGERVNADVLNLENGNTFLTVSSLPYSVSLTAECDKHQTQISYDPNGGSYRLDGMPSTPYLKGHNLKYRLRPNTEIGNDVLKRDGYVLNGWNTRADGNGEHIGLGSRVTVKENGITKLYAEWKQANAVGDFSYTINGGIITIKKYLGNSETVVVPETIENLSVTRIVEGAFSGNLKTLILPSTISYIEDGAFQNCSITDLYCYDNFRTISDGIFVNCPSFTSLHMNAIMRPRYGKDNLYSEINLADKYDLLILNADKRKVLVFGGSGAYLSVDTARMERTLKADGEDYICLNMAVNGWFNGAAQFDMMMPYLKDGDLFIHAPESSSRFSFMYDISMATDVYKFDYNKLRLYYCLESNYDLMSLIDYHHVTDLLNGFASYNEGRLAMAETTTYTDYLTEVNLFGTVYQNDRGYIDDRGNWNLPRIAQGDKLEAGEADIVPEYVTENGASLRLNSYYDAMKEKGVSIGFMPAPTNQNTLIKRLNGTLSVDQNPEHLFYGRPPEIPLTFTDLTEWVKAYDRTVAENLHTTVLTSLNEVLYPHSVFYDADYHLSDQMVPTYTDTLTKLIEEKLIKVW